MSDSKYLISGSISTFGSLILIKIITILTSVIKARFLGPELLGILAILYTIQSMLVLITSITLPTVTAKFIAEYDSINQIKNIEKVFSTTIIIAFGISLLLSLFLFIFSDIIAVNIYGREDMGALIKLLSLSIVPASMTVILDGTLQGLKKINVLAKISIITALITLPITYFFILKMNIAGAVLTIFAGSIFSLIYMAYFLKFEFSTRDIHIDFIFDKEIAKRILSFIGPIFISQALIIPSMWFGNTYLSIKQGFDVVGFYSIGNVVTQPLLFMALAISKPVLPYWSSHFSKDNNAMSHNKIKDVIRKVCFITQISVILLLLTADYIIVLVYGKQYLDSIYISYFLLLYTGILAINTTLTNFWFSRGMTKFLMIIDIISIVFFLICLFLFVPVFGGIGLALSLIINAISYMVLSLIQLKRENANELYKIYLHEWFLIMFFCVIYIIIYSLWGSLSAKLILMIVFIFFILLKKKEIVQIVSIIRSNVFNKSVNQNSEL